jgi:diguanylate cyclase (GGDEF)-like protein
VGFFDVDDLKTVNDIYGHAVGDSVIRAVVRAIREIIRAEDLIFRWGGDEFFVIMIGLEAKLANSRMAKLDKLLSSVTIDGIDQPMAIGVSHAFEDFDDLRQLETSITRADASMYKRKQIRKGLMDEYHPIFADVSVPPGALAGG